MIYILAILFRITKIRRLSTIALWTKYSYMFGQIITNFAQNVHFDKLSNEFETGSCWIKNEVTRANLLKTLWTLQAIILAHSLWLLVKMFFLVKFLMRLKQSFWVKNQVSHIGPSWSFCLVCDLQYKICSEKRLD